MVRKRGRPADPSTPYRVTSHRVGKYVYAATRQDAVDQDSGRKSTRYIHWGTIDGEKVFHPNKRFEYTSPDERKKFIFPEDWNLTEMNKLPSVRGPGRPSYAGPAKICIYGDTWLMEQIAIQRRVRQHLEIAFEGNKEMAADILSLAMFMYLVKLPFSHMSAWQELSWFPAERTLTPKDITLLCQMIRRENIDSFFALRRKQMPKQDICAVDSTTRRAYGTRLVRVTWGESKEGGIHPQTIEVIVYSLMNHEPVMYFTLPGNMSDKRVVPLILRELRRVGYDDVILITDRGYDCPRTLDCCIARKQKLITATNLRKKAILDRIQEIDTSGLPANMEFIPDKQIFATQLTCTKKVTARKNQVVEADRLRINLYFDPSRKAHELLEFGHKLHEDEIALERLKDSKQPLSNAKRGRFSYFTVKREKATGAVLSYERNVQKIAKKTKMFGFFAISTLGLDLSAPAALTSYKLRDEQEKFFSKNKSQIDGDTQRSSTEKSATGRRFIEFVSLILVCNMAHVWNTSSELRSEFPYVFAITEEMKRIHCIERPGESLFIEPFLRRQALICRAFHIDIPKGCEPEYESSPLTIE